MALGIFCIFIGACGAGVVAFSLFFLMRIAWKNGKRAVAAILAVLGAACAVFAIYLAAFIPGGIRFMTGFGG